MATFVKPEDSSASPKKSRPISLAPVREMVAKKEDTKGTMIYLPPYLTYYHTTPHDQDIYHKISIQFSQILLILSPIISSMT